MDHQVSRVPLCLLCLLCLLAASGLAAAEPRQVPKAVGDLLTQAANVEPVQVVALIDSWTGDPHPYLLLSRAQARWSLMQEAVATEQPALLTAAEADYRAALKLDPALRQAHLGLAQCAAGREDWSSASRHAAAGIDPATADASFLLFLAQVALKAEDWRLATLAAQQGILRFPAEAGLRRVELAVLIHAGRSEDARQAVLALLAQSPADAELWQHLAWAAQETDRADEALAALEAALLVKPDDARLRQQLASSQLASALPQAALATVRPLLGETPAATALADDALIRLAARAAAEGGELATARGWLAAVPEARRSRDQHLLAARYAVQAADAGAARVALDLLIAGGEGDPIVLGWAGVLAEQDGDAPRAEVLYLKAASATGEAQAKAAANASLRLAALYLKQERRDEAGQVLAGYLAQHPEDAQARALQARLDPKK